MSRQFTVGEQLPARRFEPDNVQLMLYNAVLWNGHRIHFDLPYATEVEGYPGLVLAGPMLGDWLHQIVDEWLDDRGVIRSIEYSNRAASYVGDVLTASGVITAVDNDRGTAVIDVRLESQNGDNVAPGTVTVAFNASSDSTS